MKQILALVLGLTIATFSTLALAEDTTTVYVTQSGDNAAKLCTVHPLGYDGSKCLATVPVSFADGTTWKDVKHSYDVSSEEAAALSSKGARITVHGDGGISVTCTMCKSSKK